MGSNTYISAMFYANTFIFSLVFITAFIKLMARYTNANLQKINKLALKY